MSKNTMEMEDQVVLEEKAFSSSVREFVASLNNELIEKGYIEKEKAIVHYVENPLFSNAPPTLYILHPKIMKMVEFSPNMTLEEKRALFEQAKDEIRKKAYETGEKIYRTRKKFIEFLEEIKQKLAEDCPNPELLTIEREVYYTNDDGIDQVIVRYDDDIVALDLLHLYLDYKEAALKVRGLVMYLSYKEKLKKYFESIKDKERVQLKKYMKSVYPWLDLYIVDEIEGNKLYDFSKGLISLKFDYKNEDLRKQFEADLQKAIDKVLSYRFVQQINIKKFEDMKLSKGYHFYLKGVYEADGDQYAVFESKMKANRKSLLVVFKNGVRMGSNAGRRVLRKLNVIKG